MKKCMISGCDSTVETPGVEFHEVFEDDENNLECSVSEHKKWICSEHLNQLENESSNQEEGTEKVAQVSRELIECCATGCNSTVKNNPDVTFFKLPKVDDPRFFEWGKFVCPSAKFAWMCGLHFDRSQFIDREFRLLTDEAVPQFEAGPINPVTKNYDPIRTKSSDECREVFPTFESCSPVVKQLVPSTLNVGSAVELKSEIPKSAPPVTSVQVKVPGSNVRQPTKPLPQRPTAGVVPAFSRRIGVLRRGRVIKIADGIGQAVFYKTVIKGVPSEVQVANNEGKTEVSPGTPEVKSTSTVDGEKLPVSSACERGVLPISGDTVPKSPAAVKIVTATPKQNAVAISASTAKRVALTADNCPTSGCANLCSPGSDALSPPAPKVSKVDAIQSETEQNGSNASSDKSVGSVPDHEFYCKSGVEQSDQTKNEIPQSIRTAAKKKKVGKPSSLPGVNLEGTPSSAKPSVLPSSKFILVPLSSIVGKKKAVTATTETTKVEEQQTAQPEVEKAQPEVEKAEPKPASSDPKDLPTQEPERPKSPRLGAEPNVAEPVDTSEKKLVKCIDEVQTDCDAVDCSSMYINDSSIHFFWFPNSKERAQRWITNVGGLKEGRSPRMICEYHFPEKAFLGPPTCGLIRHAVPLFRFGPLNPRTKDFCPKGEEYRSFMIHMKPTRLCCVRDCETMTLSKLALFPFPADDEAAVQIWIERLGIDTTSTPVKLIVKHFGVCMKHFKDQCKIFDLANNQCVLLFGSLPSLFIPDYKTTEWDCVLTKRKWKPVTGTNLSCLISEKDLFPYREIVSSIMSSRDPKPSTSSSLPDGHVFKRTKVTYHSPDDFKEPRSRSRYSVLPKRDGAENVVNVEGDETRRIDGDSGGAKTNAFETLVRSMDLEGQEQRDPKRGRKRKKNEAVSSKIADVKTTPDEVEDIGNEVDVGRPEVTDTPAEVPTDLALLRIFKNSFSFSTNPLSFESLEQNGHVYGSWECVNVLESAAKLCEFSQIKVKELENLLQTSRDTTGRMKKILADQLTSVMHFSSVEFFKEFFHEAFQKALDIGTINETNVTPIVRKMVIALQAHSGQAYCALNNPADLPPPRTVRDWATRRNGEPGYSRESFEFIHNLVKIRPSQCVYSLSVVEVPLKKDVHWDGPNVFGHVDLGYGPLDAGCVQEASRALLFYASSLISSHRLPLGYCLFDDLSIDVRANLVNQFIIKIHSAGGSCFSVVSDCSVNSYKMFVKLGAIPDGELTPQMGSYTHPVSRMSRVFCFIDTNQLLRRVDVMWAEKCVLKTRDKNVIDRHFLEVTKLTHQRSTENRKATGNPNSSSVKDWWSISARLSPNDPNTYYKYHALALKTVSNASRLRKGSQVIHTIAFLLNMSFFSDLFVSCHRFGEGDKGPLVRNGTWAATISRSSALFNYFTHLEDGNGVRLCQSSGKMIVAFLCLNISSLRCLARRFLSDSCKVKFNYIYTKALTLDYALSFVDFLVGDRLRTPTEFRAEYARYLSELALPPSERLVARKRPILGRPEQSSLGFLQSFIYAYLPLTVSFNSVREFIAENVIENYLRDEKCLECVHIIETAIVHYDQSSCDANIVRDIHSMLLVAERRLKDIDELPSEDFEIVHARLANLTLNSLSSTAGFLMHGHLFNNAQFGELTHFTVVVKGIVRAFLKIRLTFMVRHEKIKIRVPRERAREYRLGLLWTVT